MKMIAFWLSASLLASAQSPPSWTLSWTPNPESEQVSGYVVQKLEGTNWIIYGTTASNWFTLLKPGRYAVQATNSSAWSGLSESACTISRPTNVQIKAVITITIP